MAKATGLNRKRIVITFVILCALMILLSIRLAWVQIVRADDYTAMAINQQTSDIPIEAKRGSIFDRNGKELATSAACYAVWARPSEIVNAYKDDGKMSEVVSKLSVVLDMSSQDVKKLLTKEQALVRVAKGLEKDTADKVRELEVKGISIAENTKRFYPAGSFASQLLGSVTDDGDGRTGVELQYDEYLSGIAGRWIRNTDLKGNALAYGQEQYYKAEDGLSVVLTIDEVLQHYAENAIAKGIKTTKAKRIMCLVMDVKTGDVLAMATNPGFNPNDATRVLNKSDREEYNKLSIKDKTAYLSKMWTNPIVSDIYEPGSTFKLITTSSALETGVTSPKTHYYCTSRYSIPGTKVTLHCNEGTAHGSETLTEAVGHSCNTVQIQLALKMGKETYYDYLNMFGITDKTGIDLPGESLALVQNKNVIGPVELSTMAYGQGIAVTPIQLASAVSSIGNNGVLMQPRVVKKLVDSDGNTVKNFETQEVRKVISSKTASDMKKIMEHVVAEGGGGNAKITGYRIGGKTGTADKSENGRYNGNTYSSFIGMAPMDNPKFVCLVIVDSPKGVRYGGATAAPIAKNFMEDALPYLNISPTYTKSEEKEIKSEYAYVPNVTGKRLEDAIGILGGCNLEYEVVPKQEKESNFKIVDQYPKKGKKMKKGGTVYLYKE